MRKIPLALAVLHFLLFMGVVIYITTSNDGAAPLMWFILYYVDMPYSWAIWELAQHWAWFEAVDKSNFWHPFIFLGIGGTLWWWILGTVLVWIAQRRKK